MISEKDFFIVLLLTAGAAVVSFALGFATGERAGRIQVASGQWTCELTGKPDKTTEWVCK
jgi:hypothetical protein